MRDSKCFVAEAQLPRVYISPQRYEAWIASAQADLHSVLRDPNSYYQDFDGYAFDNNTNLLHADKQGRMYGFASPQVRSKTIIARANLETTIKDLEFGMQISNTLELRSLLVHLLQDAVVDAAVMNKFSNRTTQNSAKFIGLIWSAFQFSKMMAPHHFVYFAYDGSTVDENGKRVLFRILRSVPIEEIDISDQNFLSISHAKFSHIYLYYEEEGQVVMTTHAVHDSLSSFGYKRLLASSISNVKKTATLASAKYLHSIRLHSRTDVILDPNYFDSFRFSEKSRNTSWGTLQSATFPTRRRKHYKCCIVCLRKLNVTRSKRECQACGVFVCKCCTVQYYYYDQHKMCSAKGVIPLRFCMSCKDLSYSKELQVEYHTLMENSDVDDRSIGNVGEEFGKRDAEETFANTFDASLMKSDMHESLTFLPLLEQCDSKSSMIGTQSGAKPTESRIVTVGTRMSRLQMFRSRSVSIAHAIGKTLMFRGKKSREANELQRKGYPWVMNQLSAEKATQDPNYTPGTSDMRTCTVDLLESFSADKL